MLADFIQLLGFIALAAILITAAFVFVVGWRAWSDFLVTQRKNGAAAQGGHADRRPIEAGTLKRTGR